MNLDSCDLMTRRRARRIAAFMPRKARVEFAGAAYHLLDRGDRREPIFRDERYRENSYPMLCAKALSGTRSFASALKYVGPGSWKAS